MNRVTIERIEITSFGKLKMTQVTPGEGLNLLSAPNESGKSTLAAFLRFIFYGYTNGRMQNIIDNDKKLYTPWDNPQSEGAVYINTDSGRYKIERKYLQSGKESLEVFETRTGKLLNTGLQPGEYFFGVNEQVFERTAFFKQLTLPSGRDDYIAEQLQNIAMSADEKINTGKALDRLSKARNMLSGRGKSGLIPALEAEKGELELKLEKASDDNKQIQLLSDKIAEARRFVSSHSEKIARLEDEKSNLAKYEAFLRLTQLRELERESVHAGREFEEASAMLKTNTLPDSQRINALLTLNAIYKTDLDAKNKAYENLQIEEKELESLQSDEGFNRDRAETIKKRAKYLRTARAVFTGAAVLTAAGAILLVWLLAVALVLLVPAIILTFSLGKLFKEAGVKNYKSLSVKMSEYPLTEQRIADKKKKIATLNEEYSRLTEKTESGRRKLEQGIFEYMDADKAMSYYEQIEYISDSAQKIRQKQTVYNEKKSMLEKAAHEVNTDTLAELASGAVRPERERVKVEQELSFYTQQMKIYQEREREQEKQKAMLEGRGSDPAVIAGKLEAVKTRLAEYTVKLSSFELAIGILSEASDYMKSTVAPCINQYASSFFGSATNDKYKNLSVDTAMAMSFTDETGVKSCDYLSAGTRDSAYLCLRLALIRLLYGNANPPLILDDAFGRMDDERLKAILTLLSGAGREYQIFIFTCGDRESKLLDMAGVQYMPLSLQQK